MEEGAPKLTTARRLKASCTCLRGAPPTVPYEGIACSACTIVSGDASAGKKSFIFTSKKENKKTSQEPRGKRMSELAHGWEAVASGDEFYYWNRYGVPNIHFSLVFIPYDCSERLSPVACRPPTKMLLLRLIWSGNLRCVCVFSVYLTS